MAIDESVQLGVAEGLALMEKVAATGIEMTMSYGPKLFLALLVLFFGMSAIKGAMLVLNKAMARANVEATLQRFMSSMIGGGAKAVLLVIFASMIGIETTSLIAVLGAAGLAIGLALQGSLANLAGGVLILFFKPFKVGDMIEAQGFTGVVRDIQIFNTVLTTTDNQRIIIPNGALSNDCVRNITAEPTRRVDLPLPISLDSDVATARAALLALAKADSRVLAEPAPEVRQTGYSESAINLCLRAWVNTPDYWPVYFDLTEQAKEALAREQLSIARPQRRIVIEQPKEQ